MQRFAYEPETDRWIVYSGGDYYCALHCGDCFSLKVEGSYFPVRVEMDNDWYVILDIYKIVLNPKQEYAIYLV